MTRSHATGEAIPTAGEGRSWLFGPAVYGGTKRLDLALPLAPALVRLPSDEEQQDQQKEQREEQRPRVDTNVALNRTRALRRSDDYRETRWARIGIGETRQMRRG